MSAKIDALTRAKFILKLAGDASRNDGEVSAAILAQLREAERDPDFPNLYGALVPANYDSLTKLASDLQRRRLTDATHRYADLKKAR